MGSFTSGYGFCVALSFRNVYLTLSRSYKTHVIMVIHGVTLVRKQNLEIMFRSLDGDFKRLVMMTLEPLINMTVCAFRYPSIK